MKKNDAKSFQEQIFEKMSFIPEKHSHFTLYHNARQPKLGYSLQYERPECYTLGIADYRVAQSFSLPFAQKSKLLRFGVFYVGQSEYQLQGKKVAHSTPSAFLVLEDNIEGIQYWKKGQPYKGIEITLTSHYLEDILQPLYSSILLIEKLQTNLTYHYLPEEIIRIIEQLSALSKNKKLNPLYLESKILECLAILIQALEESDNLFSAQMNYGKIKIGTSRQTRLTPSDIQSIQLAHKILETEHQNPPTITELSRQVLLNEQKLKIGFSYYYQMSIGDFIQSVRMTLATNLLCTTDKSIETIAKEVGYSYSSNFSRTFQKIYNRRPLDFRREKSH